MKKLLLGVLCLLVRVSLFAGGEPSTYFNIFVPPNNDAVQRNVALIVTAIYDSTHFEIIDDGMDGDTDDSVTGVLQAGQSYILYIKDNGINDDAQYASGGMLKRDGDYFIIHSDKLVYALMSTDSDWQHDFVPSVNKKSVGNKFIIYGSKISSSKRDLNVFPYEDGTSVTISKISQSATLQTGYTNVNFDQRTIVAQQSLNRGQDIIHAFQVGRNIMNNGETYLVESNKPISVQYGALFQNERDGGGYVPSSNGSSSGELFYFAVPYQASGEQEIRIVSWNDQNNITLERYNNGTWTNVSTWTLNRLQPADWVGKRNGNVSYPTVFRVTCSAGKKVSVFEANWMETGSPGTSDEATMASSEAGTTSGKDFLLYLLPPGKENNVLNPFSGAFFNGNFSHFYLFAGKDTATITVKDAKTNGTIINRTYTILPERYVDCAFSLNEWKSIYNGTGNPSDGPDRPYLLVQSNKNIAVLNTNFNDNWLAYLGSSLPNAFNVATISAQSTVIPGQVSTLNTVLAGTANVYNPSVRLEIGSGLIPLSSTLSNGVITRTGIIDYREDGSTITFAAIPTLTPQDNYTVSSQLLTSAAFNNGATLPNNTVMMTETIFSGLVEGEPQQAVATAGIQNQTSNTSNLIFTACTGTLPMTTANNDTWNGAWIDYDNDGWEDLFVCDKADQSSNKLYKNNGNGSFSLITSGDLANETGKTVSSTWGDYDNDGRIDVFIVNATGKRSMLYRNAGNGNFVAQPNAGIEDQPQYFHGASWLDMDNDGYLDLLVTNFFETRFHHLYKNNRNGTFSRWNNSPITLESERALAPICADYNNDGLVDVFIPNGNNRPNSLFKNLGNGQFQKITTGAIATDTANSVGAAWGDYNNDGRLDLFVCNASGQKDVLYRNEGNDNFTAMTTSILSQDNAHSHGAIWMDMDNDMDLDLLVNNAEGANLLYKNDGQGGFTRILYELISANTYNSYGCAAADYNKNGSLDVAIFTHTNKNDKLFCNQGNSNGWINIKLVGTNSNKNAIGARIHLKANGIWQIREVNAQSGFGSQNSLRQHFGLANAAQIDSIRVDWPSGYKQYLTQVNKNQFITITEENAYELSGVSFHDRNGNCVRDAGEELIANIALEVGDLALSTDDAGAYKLRLAATNHDIKLKQSNYWEKVCPTQINLQANSTLNIPLRAISQEYDLSLEVGSSAWRRGFAAASVFHLRNLGANDAYNVVLQSQYPAGISVISSNYSFTQQGQQYSWTIDTLRAGQAMQLEVMDQVGLSTSVGQELSRTSTVSAQGSDANMTNNSANELLEVVGAIDPNDLLASPKGKGSEGYISSKQALLYTVRFQNVGTYPASFVRIENVLNEGLDLTTFEVVAASHAYQYTMSEDGFLNVHFDNINLVDSATNESASHGFFTYRILPKQNLAGGTKIENQVAIGFDYEDFILTNKTVHTIQFPKNPNLKELLVYPNPAKDIVIASLDKDHLKFEGNKSIHQISVYNSGGNVCYQKTLESPYPEAILDISMLTNGIYLVQIVDNTGAIQTAKLVIAK